jgi:diguanylate cyclase (GGDEF)-like protein
MIMNLPLIVLGAALAAAAILLAISGVLWFRLRAKLRETRQALEETAATDALTGIPNHKHLLSRFEEEFQKCRRYKGGVGCVLIDIDHFKKINAVHGHHAGDRVLRKLAKLVKSSIRSYDVLGRYGDEEFLALVPGADIVQATTFAERIRVMAGTRIFVESDKAPRKAVSTSLGVTVWRPDDANIDVILKRANEALNLAIRAGGNRVEKL